ncbi:MAG: hypothetical protein KKE65_10740, partial [Actinobacteria bacterium]|nr:hypothetical protein [Actinomycetota bacterium]
HGQVYLHDSSGTRGLDKLDHHGALDKRDNRRADRPYTAVVQWYETGPIPVPDLPTTWSAA